MNHQEQSDPIRARTIGSAAAPSGVVIMVMALGLGVAGVGGVGGCQSLTRSAIEPAATPTAAAAPRAEVVSDRPMVKVTAADLYSWGPGAATQQLEFYDELERRDLVAHDDLLHAALLFADGSSGATFQQRLELAKGHGWLDRRFNRPGREAVTVGEAVQVMARMMSTPGSESPDDAVAAFRGLGLVPEGAEAGQGLTGPQLLALLTNSYDYLEAGETGPRSMAQRPPEAQRSPEAQRQPDAAHPPEPPPVAVAEATPARPAPAGGESFEQFETAAATPPLSTPPSSTPSPSTPPPAAPTPRPRPATIDLPATETAAASPPVGATQTPRAMKEPLPVVPMTEQPRPAVVNAPAPLPQPPARAADEAPLNRRPTPRPWVGGRPLNKKRSPGQ